MNSQEVDIISAFRQYQIFRVNQDIQQIGSQNHLFQQFIKNVFNSEPGRVLQSSDKNNQVNIPLNNQQAMSINQQKEQDNQDDEISETLSLSYISDKIYELNFQHSPQWRKDFSKYGELFESVSLQRRYIKTNKFNNFLRNDFSVLIEQGYDTKLYSGFRIDKKEWIVIKEQIIEDNQLQDSAQQFIIHYQIYNLHPNKFLQLLKPVYIKELEGQNKFQLISLLEYGEINLYDYSQLNQIKEIEFKLIFQQIYQQIMLLHNHNIAHRDIKPQNIVYVESKGWLLCDFGDSLKYQDVNGIYDIRGTQAFLQPYLQLLSHTQGISVKQNLLVNDIYALAITLIIIKYQLKHQNEIPNYLKEPGDQIIEQLIKSPNQNNNLEYQYSNEISFIGIQIHQPLKPLTISEISIQDIESFINILSNYEAFVDKNNEEIKFKILDIINLKLAQNDEHFNYLNILCYAEIPEYLPQLKNLIKFSKLRQRRYWKQIFRKKLILQNRDFIINQIRFMYVIGLSDLTLYYARIFLNNDYDFFVHLIIVSILVQFKQYNQAINEYNLIQEYRESKYMDDKELDRFIFLTLHLVKWDKLDDQEIKFVSESTNFQILKINPIYILQSNLQDKDLIQQLINNLFKIFQKQLDNQIYMHELLDYIQVILYSVDMEIFLQFIELVKQKIKYICTNFVWQILLSFQTLINIELSNKSLIKKHLKEINYVLICNNESQRQYKILKFTKTLTYLHQGIKNSNRKYKMQIQIYEIITKLDQINIDIYKLYILNQLIRNMMLISYQEYNQILYFKTITYLCNKPNYISLLKALEFNIFIAIVNDYFKQQLNFKRYCLLKKAGQSRNVIKYGIIQYSFQNDLKLLLQKKIFQKLQFKFLRNQYFVRT